MKFIQLAGILSLLLIGGCASDMSSKYASLNNLSDTERNNALKDCFKEENKHDRQECIAEFADPAIGYQCERIQVTGTRFGERVCTTKRQRDEVARASQDAFSQVQMRNKFTKGQEAAPAGRK
ncbi:hypothetical protein [Lacimicrobium alkaliphilum]|uniref:Lipoprotein n=1 Tax=Lacimicrobium alkaliphilum TaxID=1526571 RepID=A0A0U3AWU6_9ALTE|nr:hypothetical protein [Lacimicrobium alkaliphilum]ALS97432.1 hypothetical protein AT746_03515 [Lacimicrobium alkaliphilum]